MKKAIEINSNERIVKTIKINDTDATGKEYDAIVRTIVDDDKGLWRVEAFETADEYVGMKRTFQSARSLEMDEDEAWTLAMVWVNRLSREDWR